MQKPIIIILLLTLLVGVTSCRTTRNVSTCAQSDFVGISHETDSATSSMSLSVQGQRFLSLSIDSLFFVMPEHNCIPTSGLILQTLPFEEAETAQPYGASRSRPQSSNARQRKPMVKVYGIHLSDSAGLQASGQSACKNTSVLADSVSSSSAVQQKTVEYKPKASSMWLFLLIAITVICFLVWKMRK